MAQASEKLKDVTLYSWHDRIHNNTVCVTRRNPSARRSIVLSAADLDLDHLAQLCSDPLCVERWERDGLARHIREMIAAADTLLTAGEPQLYDPALMLLTRQRNLAVARLAKAGILSSRPLRVDNAAVLWRLYEQRCAEFGVKTLTSDELWNQWVPDDQRELFDRAESYRESADVWVKYRKVWPGRRNLDRRFLLMAADVVVGAPPTRLGSDERVLPTQALHDAVVRPNLGGLMLLSGLSPLTPTAPMPLQYALLLLARGVYVQQSPRDSGHPSVQMRVKPSGPFGQVLQALGLPMTNDYGRMGGDPELSAPLSMDVPAVAAVWEAAAAALD